MALRLSSRIEAGLLLIITAVAAALRFFRLGQWSFWEDELFTLSGLEDGFNYSFLRRSITSDLIRVIVNWLGTNEWNARLLPAVIGTLTIPILYLLLRKQFGKNAAFITAGLLAISTWHLYWSQNARFYVSLLLFYTLASVFLYTGLEKNKPWHIGLAIIFLGLAVKERLLALLLVPVVVSYLVLLFALKFERPPGLNWKNLSILIFPGVIGGIFFAGPYLGNLSGWFEGFYRINNSPFWILSGVIYYVGVAVASVALVGLIFWLAQKNRAALFFGLNALVPLVLLMALSLFQYTANRYVFMTLPSWLLLAAMSVSTLVTTSMGRQKILAAAAAVVLITTSIGDNFLYYQYQNGNRPNWRAAMGYIANHQKPGDLIVNISPQVGMYYFHEKQIGFNIFDPEEAEDQGKRIWFVLDLTVQELYPDHLAWIKENASLKADYDVRVYARDYVMRVYLFDPWIAQAADPEQEVK